MKNLALTYCTNVHPLADWASWQSLIGRFGKSIREDLNWTALPLGLWFPASLISDPNASSQKVIQLLAQNQLSAFTCNAFPYGNFHDKVVKTKVYEPDWTDSKRLDYTIACAKMMAEINSSSAFLSLSTLPLGWRVGWTNTKNQIAAENLCHYISWARNFFDAEDKSMALGLEPEPGCVLETIDQVVEFWNQYLRPAAAKMGITENDLQKFFGICYDTCHQAVQFEDAEEALKKLSLNGIRIVKMQLSSALEFKVANDEEGRAVRKQFIEERFLHQTRIKTLEGMVSFDDLPEACLVADKQDPVGLYNFPWRVHFHLPIHAEGMLAVNTGSSSNLIGTTRGEMLKAYHYAIQNKLCSHFEIETYTWNVLPNEHRPQTDADLAKCIADEIRFIVSHTPDGVSINDHAA